MKTINLTFKCGIALLLSSGMAFGASLNFDRFSPDTVSKDTSNYTSQIKSAESLSKYSKYDKYLYVPRLYLAGAGGYDGWAGLGQGDLLMPVLVRYDRALFLYGQGRYGYDAGNSNSAFVNSSTWTGSLGLGYRQIVGNSAILGLYVLGDYTKTALGHAVIMASPGFEVLGRAWDFRMNGYFPVAGKTKSSTTGWADEFGDYNYIVNQGHFRSDAKFTFYEETGMGADVEVGRKLFTLGSTLFKLYGNGYFYKMKHGDNVMGGGARLTIEPTNYLKFFASDSYDNYQKNVVVGGLQVDLYNLITNRNVVDPNDLGSRLFSPIERNFATIARGSNAREAGSPNDPKTKPVIHVVPKPKPGPNPKPDPNYVENDNAWYFVGTTNSGLPGDKRIVGAPGTAEDPYVNLTQDELNQIAQYDAAHGYKTTDIYVKGTGDSYNLGGQVNVPQAFTVHGVEADLSTPAKNADRPILIGSLGLSDGDVLNNVIVKYDPNNPQATTTGININNANGMTILNDDDVSGFATGVELTGGSNATMVGTDISAINESGDAYGIKIDTPTAVGDGGSLTIAGDTTDKAENPRGLITVNATNGTAYGIGTDAKMPSPIAIKKLALSDSDITVSDKGIGLYADNVAVGSIINSTFMRNGTSSVGSTGIELNNSGPITMDDVIIGSSDGSKSFETGINLFESGVNIQGDGTAIYGAGNGVGIIASNSDLILDNVIIGAVGSPNFNDGIDLTSSIATIKDGTVIYGDGIGKGIVANSSTLTLDGVTVGTAANTPTDNFITGVDLSAGSNATITNSTINAHNDAGETDGIKVDDSTLNISGGTVTANSLVNTANNNLSVYGINAENQSVLQSTNTGISASGGQYTRAVYLKDDGFINKSTINGGVIYAIGNSASTVASGIDIANSDLEMDGQTKIYVNNAVPNSGIGYGVYVDSGVFTIPSHDDYQTIINVYDLSSSTGIYVLGSSILNIGSHTSITAKGQNVAYGIDVVHGDNNDNPNDYGQNVYLHLIGNHIQISATGASIGIGLYIPSVIAKLDTPYNGYLPAVSGDSIYGSTYGIVIDGATPASPGYLSNEEIQWMFNVLGGSANIVGGY